MKRQVLLSIAFSVFAVNAFAATSAYPVVVEGGSDRLIESRVAEGGSDRLIENRVAADGSDRLIENRVAADGSDRLIENRVAADGSDRLIENRVAAWFEWFYRDTQRKTRPRLPGFFIPAITRHSSGTGRPTHPACRFVQPDHCD
ncbi:hypothetical protein PS685_05321 [Pseudomonas fluorescens]|uniref:Phage infection protein n=1 Tax=Pseudomonas fluorescens TaxID=294 RepID=A0A5E7AP94_PSEFL|nr:hypothetical protein PS685_05321 [Pseudomonas fluorescens]